MLRNTDQASRNLFADRIFQLAGLTPPSSSAADRVDRAVSEARERTLVTASLPYVNNSPHLGNIVGSLLSADVYARYCRLRGRETLFISGTDEYGTTSEVKAKEEGTTPQELCDKYHAKHRQVYDWFEVSYDRFGRTSTPKHTEMAQELFSLLHSGGWLKQRSQPQLFCPSCDRLLADRMVEGICPKCGQAGARGDQCDSCGGVHDATELGKPVCLGCRASPVVRSSPHLYLDLPGLESQLKEFFDSAPARGHWNKIARSITRPWLDNLKERCITRDLSWGVPLPIGIGLDPEFSSKVMYVWFEALLGYMSITADHTPDWERWWKAPNEVKLVMFMGKDNVVFHTTMLPATLIGASLNQAASLRDKGSSECSVALLDDKSQDPTKLGSRYTLPTHISATEFLTYKAQKFSKSKRLGVFGEDAMKSGIPPSAWRYALMCNRPETGDSDFSMEELASRCNTDLVNTVGNFFQRGLKLISTHLDSTLDYDPNWTPADIVVMAQASVVLTEYIQALDKQKLKYGLELAVGLAHVGNRYYQTEDFFRPFTLKGNPSDQEPNAQRLRIERSKAVLAVGTMLCNIIAHLLSPYIPSSANRMALQLNRPLGRLSMTAHDYLLPTGHRIGVPEPLFQRIDLKCLR